MDWASIGQWAGDKGPYVAIIGAQWGVIWKLLNRFFAQQEVVMKALNLAERTSDIAEKKVRE